MTVHALSMMAIIVLLARALLAGLPSTVVEENRNPAAGEDPTDLVILLISQESLECPICTESITSRINTFDKTTGRSALLGLIIPETPLQLGSPEYKVFARQAAGFSLKNGGRIPFFPLPGNIFPFSPGQNPVLLFARITDRFHVSSKAFSDPAASGRKSLWSRALHTGLVQLGLTATAVFVFFRRKSRFARIHALLGSIWCSWYPWRVPAIAEGRFQLVAWVIAGGLCIVLVAAAGTLWLLGLLASLVLLTIAMNSFSSFQAGEKGLKLDLRFLPWAEVSRWKLDQSRKTLFLAQGEFPPAITSLRIPARLQDPLLERLRSQLPEKQFPPLPPDPARL